MSEISVEEYVEIYLAIRGERERIAAEFAEKDDTLKADMAQLEAGLLDICNKVGANSINTKLGTVIRSTKERFICNDWDNFKQYVMENNAIDCLERRIHQGNFKAMMADNEGAGLPPGVNVMREFAVTVRKASK